MPDPIANAGLYGAGANLPSGGGPIDPPTLFWGPSPTPTPNPTWNPAWLGQAGGGIQGGANYPTVPADFWTRLDPNMGFINPSLTVNPGENYPAPGTGAPPPPSTGENLFTRTPLGALFHGIAAARRGTFMDDTPIGRFFRRMTNQTWQQNAQANPGSMQGPIPVPPGGALFGYNPAQGGGTSHYDPATGRVTQTPSLNPLYTTGGNWEPVANAPVDIRFSKNSGTGNWTADQTTKNWLAGGGYAGTPNKSQPDVMNQFFPTAGIRTHLDETGATTREPVTSNPANAGLTQSRRDLYNEALKAVGPKRGNEAGLDYTRRINEYIANNNGSLQPFAWMTASQPTISGPPQLPDWLFGG